MRWSTTSPKRSSALSSLSSKATRWCSCVKRSFPFTCSSGSRLGLLGQLGLGTLEQPPSEDWLHGASTARRWRKGGHQEPSSRSQPAGRKPGEETLLRERYRNSTGSSSPEGLCMRKANTVLLQMRSRLPAAILKAVVHDEAVAMTNTQGVFQKDQTKKGNHSCSSDPALRTPAHHPWPRRCSW
jgi:hypothetical protein